MKNENAHYSMQQNVNLNTYIIYDNYIWQNSGISMPSILSLLWIIIKPVVGIEDLKSVCR